jgi:1-acyl-sn-glycerol-3-phosphate acyltransferase
MLMIKAAHTLFLYLLTVLSFFIGTGITLCIVLFSKEKTKTFQAAAHNWARFLMFFSGVKVITSGFENFSVNHPAILVANHQGAADIPVLLAYLPVRFRFAIKKELFTIPFFGWYLRQAGFFSVDREMILSAYKTLETIVAIIKTGESVLIFPEGTRSRDGSLGKFKRGSLMAALKSGAPIVPIALSGSYNIQPRGTLLVNPARVKLSIGKPIYIKTEEEYNNKVEEVRKVIAEML